MRGPQLQIHLPQLVAPRQGIAGPLQHKALLERGAILPLEMGIVEPGGDAAGRAQDVVFVDFVVLRDEVQRRRVRVGGHAGGGENGGCGGGCGGGGGRLGGFATGGEAAEGEVERQAARHNLEQPAVNE